MQTLFYQWKLCQFYSKFKFNKQHAHKPFEIRIHLTDFGEEQDKKKTKDFAEFHLFANFLRICFECICVHKIHLCIFIIIINGSRFYIEFTNIFGTNQHSLLAHKMYDARRKNWNRKKFAPLKISQNPQRSMVVGTVVCWLNEKAWELYKS